MADSIWTTLGKLLLSFLSNKAEGKTEVEVSIPFMEKAFRSLTIKWDDPLCSITPHFMVGDAIALHSWDRLANADDGLTDDGKVS